MHGSEDDNAQNALVGVVLCSSCCAGKIKKVKNSPKLSRNWKVIPSELSHRRIRHISLCKNVILEEPSFRQTVLAWTICLDMEVGIAEWQDPMELCSLLYPTPPHPYILFSSQLTMWKFWMLAETCTWPHTHIGFEWDLLWLIAQGDSAHLRPKIKRLGSLNLIIHQ